MSNYKFFYYIIVFVVGGLLLMFSDSPNKTHESLTFLVLSVVLNIYLEVGVEKR